MKEIDLMYPHITQLEARQRELERELDLLRAREQARANEAERAARRPAPPRHKLALLTWVAAYAVITVLLALLGPTIAPWPLALRTLVLSALMVAVLTWAIVPLLARIFRGWLVPHYAADEFTRARSARHSATRSSRSLRCGRRKPRARHRS